MIRSSTISLKFTNPKKLQQLALFLDEYTRVVGLFIDSLWPLEKVPTLLPKKVTSTIDTWLSARAIQAAGKQASGIIRGTRKKQEQRLWRIHQLEKAGELKRANKLQVIYQKHVASKPNVSSLQPSLDARFIKIIFENPTTFDGWITLGSLGKKLKIILPFKKHKHLNSLLLKGNLLGSLRISREAISLNFELAIPPQQEGTVLGIDVGLKKTVSVSNGFQTNQDIHGWTLQKIITHLSRRVKGSKGFRRASTHRKNFINWSINQLNLQGIKEVRREALKSIRMGKQSSKELSHWTYADIFDKLDRYCEEHGVRVITVPYAYTSQRCSVCGWVKKTNRKGEDFICSACGFKSNADVNASRNIVLNLRGVSKEIRLSHINKVGFYWNETVRELIVPETQNL